MLNDQVAVQELRCERHLKPLGIDVSEPRLSWIMEAAQRNKKQIAYQIQVASSPDLLTENIGDLWDSGKVVSPASTDIAYAGEPLQANMSCFWKVKVWDKSDAPSLWSDIAQWTMGLLRPDDWQAQWIGMPESSSAKRPETGFANENLKVPEAVSPWLRKTFSLDTLPVRALVYVNAVEYFELHINNGTKVGQDVLSPAVSVLKRRA